MPRSPRPMALPATHPGVARAVGVLFGAWAGTIGLEMNIGPVDVNAVFFFAGAALAFLFFAISRLARLRLGGVDLAAILLIISRYVVEQISASTLQHTANVQGLSISLYLLGAYFLVRLTVTSVEEMRAFLGGLVVLGWIVAVVAVLQVLHVGSVTSFILEYTNSSGAAARLEDGRLTRATSLIGHWSGLGGYFTVLAAVAGVASALDRRAGRKPSGWMLTTLVFSAVGVVTTFTFAAIGMVSAVIVAVMFSLGYRIRFVVATAAVATIAVALFGDSLDSRVEQQQSATSYLPEEFSWVPATLAVRIYYWLNESLPAFFEQPIWGWGHSVYSLGRTWATQPLTIVWPYPESEYIRVLVTGGLIEMFFFVVWVLLVLRVISRSRAHLGSGTRLIALTMMAALLAGSIINPYFSNPGAPALLWPFIAAIAWTQRAPTSTDPASHVPAMRSHRQ